jgi:hypothetical protein
VYILSNLACSNQYERNMTCRTHGTMRNGFRILVGHLNREGYLQDLFLDGSIILKDIK